MTAPLRVSFDVACSADHAFSVWTSAGDRWRDRNQAGWQSMIPHFISAINERGR
jgi:hypothetical protein